ncbi:MAG: ATP-binding protein [Pirellula sp.]
MIGPPGSGKTMLAKRLSSILPTLSPGESMRDVWPAWSCQNQVDQSSGDYGCQQQRSSALAWPSLGHARRQNPTRT